MDHALLGHSTVGQVRPLSCLELLKVGFYGPVGLGVRAGIRAMQDDMPFTTGAQSCRRRVWKSFGPSQVIHKTGNTPLSRPTRVVYTDRHDVKYA